MEKNVLFILIDGLRADQCNDKADCKTNFFDKLISKGITFDNTFSSADGTFISLNCLFNSKFQYETGIRSRKIVLQDNNFLELFQKNGYTLHGLIPDLKSLEPLKKYFKNKKCTYSHSPPPETLTSGLSEQIKKIIESLKKEKQWFFYIHLFDLHPLREGRIPRNLDRFSSSEFGNSLYSKTVSMINQKLNETLEHIDLDNTIIVLTSDHGERIPLDDKLSFEFEPKLDFAKKIGKKVIPESFHKKSGRFLGSLKKSIAEKRLEKENKNLNNYQIRSRDPYFTLSLFDELLHIPLIISGIEYQGKKNKSFVSQLDIFPTLCDLLEINDDEKRHGKSLIPMINDNSIVREPIFIHTIPYENESHLDRMGIRSEKFKYFRNSRESTKDVNLYDIINDPFENDNLAEKEPEKIEEMEKILVKFQQETKIQSDESDDDEIRSELRKLGYL
ncbi:MAG: hypothetical protein CL763_10235 [Chloroflexi bacterium]|nr:hypothetical protein [Chloroflexota bacterium]|tara:strand:+ start:6670 stop:8007 length:1338 start_codon:yes stop_codon:yes gene_type:complete